jgi:hypothetical protein
MGIDSIDRAFDLEACYRIKRTMEWESVNISYFSWKGTGSV